MNNKKLLEAVEEAREAEALAELSVAEAWKTLATIRASGQSSKGGTSGGRITNGIEIEINITLTKEQIMKTPIDKSNLSASERDLADMLDECIKEHNLRAALEGLFYAGDEFPLRKEYLTALGEMLISEVAELEKPEPVTPAEETILMDSLN